MSISTKDRTKEPGYPTLEDKRDNLKKLREHHQPTLDKLGLSDATLLGKLDYQPTGSTEICVALFQSEISKGEDVFIEFAHKDNTPRYEERTLYKWKFNPHFDEEYDHDTTRYFIPVAELVKVETPSLDTKTEIAFELTDPDQDLPMNQMTMRDYAAIHMRKPVSRKSWLNELITKNP